MGENITALLADAESHTLTTHQITMDRPLDILAGMGHRVVLYATRGLLRCSRGHGPNQGRGCCSVHRGIRRMPRRRHPNGGYIPFPALVLLGVHLLMRLVCLLHSRTMHG